AEPPPETPPDPRPPPPNSPPPPSAKASAPVRIGISMSSTSAAGGFAAPVGNTLYGASPKIAADPNSVRPYASPDGRYAAPQNGRYVPPARVSTLPKLSREARASYPEAARRAGIEGQVVLRLRVNDKGDVIEARVVESAGHGFDESALAAVKQFKFQPGTLDGAAVMTDITYTYTFLLD
ncbi:MAG: energy transducer TonB, partial [Myxococcaceae bacterium]|nr:energy transducer TonB [Myxococcaceae bacterium]